MRIFTNITIGVCEPQFDYTTELTPVQHLTHLCLTFMPYVYALRQYLTFMPKILTNNQIQKQLLVISFFKVKLTICLFEIELNF